MILVWPVKFKRSVVGSFEFRGFRGVASSSSFDDVLFLEDESNRNGRCAVFGVLVMTELRSCLEGDQGSALGCFEGEVRMFASRVKSVGIAEIVLRSPTVSSFIVLSSKPSVKSSNAAPLSSKLSVFSRSGEAIMLLLGLW